MLSRDGDRPACTRCTAAHAVTAVQDDRPMLSRATSASFVNAHHRYGTFNAIQEGSPFIRSSSALGITRSCHESRILSSTIIALFKNCQIVLRSELRSTSIARRGQLQQLKADWYCFSVSQSTGRAGILLSFQSAMALMQNS